MTTSIGFAVCLPVACWLAMCTRWVPRGERVAVLRGAVVRRVHEAGAAYRVPFVESFAVVPSDAHDVPLMVRATTNDGLRVVLLAEVTVVLPRPEPGTRYAHPWPATELVAEDAIARAVAGWSTTELLQGVSAYHRSLRHAVSAAVDDHGVALLELELVSVDVQVDEGALERDGR